MKREQWEMLGHVLFGGLGVVMNMVKCFSLVRQLSAGEWPAVWGPAVHDADDSPLTSAVGGTGACCGAWLHSPSRVACVAPEQAGPSFNQTVPLHNTSPCSLGALSYPFFAAVFFVK